MAALRGVRPSPARGPILGVGAPKTGTHSLVALFQGALRARHEPWVRRTVRLIRAQRSGALDAAEQGRRLRGLIAGSSLELVASHPLGHFTDVLAQALPEARFLLTVREPAPWLDSMLNHLINHPRRWWGEGFWRELRRVYFGPGPWRYPAQEQVLAARGLPNLDALLAFYAGRNRLVLDAVAPERLLVVHTEQLDRAPAALAAFAGIPTPRLRPRAARAYAAPRRHALLADIAAAYLEERIAAHWAPLRERLAPPCD